MFVHQIHLPHHKHSAENETIELPLPSKVTISMAQHLGAPCTPAVSIGDKVKIGDVIASSEAVMSAPVHSSISGTVTAITDVLHISGKYLKSIVIESDGLGEVSEKIMPPVIESREDFLKAVRESGSIGLGGAGFPTSMKLGFDPKEKQPDVLIINGAECEPYITSDYRCFIEDGESVLDGIKLIMKWLSIPKCIIGIEKNKPKAIDKMTRLCKDAPEITVMGLKSSYPQGAEKTLIYSTTKRVVKEGMLPISSGCIVLNSSTVAFISEYIKTGMPLVRRRITIDGNIVGKPQNVMVAVGASLSEIVAFADLKKEPDRIILGGPMMGSCAFDLDYPLSKTNNAVLLFADTPVYEPSACIRCGRCVRACSMNLLPTELEHAFDAGDVKKLNDLKVHLCVNCGACSYVCPAKRNIAEKNQLAKNFVREQMQKMKKE